MIFYIINFDEANKIDFTKVKESRIETLRVSKSGKTFIEINDENDASFLELFSFKEKKTRNELIELLGTEDWKEEIKIPKF